MTTNNKKYNWLHTARSGSKPTYQNGISLPSPPDAVGWKLGLALQLAVKYSLQLYTPQTIVFVSLPPHDQFLVFVAEQKALLAKKVKGLNFDMAAGVSVENDCRGTREAGTAMAVLVPSSRATNRKRRKAI
jgi:hypothetical protein